MKRNKIIFALFVGLLLHFVVIRAWAADPGKLPPQSIDKSKVVESQKLDKIKPSPVPGCTPKTCEELGAYCGSISDGCGHVVECGIAKQISVTVDPPQYTGVCPKTFKFTGTITVSKKGKVCYSFYNNYSFDGHGGTAGKSGELMFDGPGTKQVFYEWGVPINLPQNYQYVYFSASGAATVKVPFIMNCTKVFKPNEGIPQDRKQ
jgi:hypothetical protein